jgi:hypothetical protein
MQQKHEEEKSNEQKLSLGPNRVCNEHNFVRRKQSEAYCTKCPVGYYIPPGGELKEGHIYIDGQRLI